jgi:V/A-type H+/Na+-transporting ATPase subunit D
MPQTQPPATRQELLKLRRKLKRAARGRSLLKDKRDSLMKLFLQTIKEAIVLRGQFDDQYLVASRQFSQASVRINQDYLDSLAQTSTTKIAVQTGYKHLMGVKVPDLSGEVKGNFFSYSVMQTNARLDSALSTLQELLPVLLKLLEMEHTALLLAQEIEKTRRRVNALDNIVIPQMKAQMKDVQSKLEEHARSVTIGLMKVKQSMGEI